MLQMGPAPVGEAGAGNFNVSCSSAMTKHEPPKHFKSPEQLKRSIAEAARQLVEAVRAHIDARGRVSSSLIARIAIDDRFVGVSFVDYPDDFLDLVEWKRR
jgi:hypothetical protein